MQNRMTNPVGPQGLTLVLGGTGKIGHRVLERLSDRGIPARAASRTAEPVFDWNDRRGWRAVLDGVAVVFISYAPDLAIPGATDTVRAFVERAVGQDVNRLVLLSGRGEDEAQRCERIVQSAGVEWSVVREEAGLTRTSPRAPFWTRFWTASSRSRPGMWQSPSSMPTTSPMSPSPRWLKTVITVRCTS